MTAPTITTPTPAEEQAAAGAKRALSAGLAFSAVRCILMYVVLPFVLPLIGLTGVFAVRVDLVINLLAMGALGYSVRRFWVINYKHKMAYTAVAAVAFFVLAAFVLLDLQELGVLNLGL
jgi:uncharacterized RDD family membrane protein YckC